MEKTQVELIHNYVPDGMRYREIDEFPHYNIHPFRELEWWLGSKRFGSGEDTNLGWQFTHLPEGEIALSLWEYVNCRSEGAHITILVEPMVEEINKHDSTDYSVVWEVKAAHSGSGVHRCTAWSERFGSVMDSDLKSFWFVPGEDSVLGLAEWVRDWARSQSELKRGNIVWADRAEESAQ